MRTEALFASMAEQAKAAGEALIGKERELDRLFAARTITADSRADALHTNRAYSLNSPGSSSCRFSRL